MSLQKPMPGTARRRKADWVRGRGPGSMGGELKWGISLRRKQLNKKCDTEQRRRCGTQSIREWSKHFAKWILHEGGMSDQSSRYAVFIQAGFSVPAGEG